MSDQPLSKKQQKKLAKNKGKEKKQKPVWNLNSKSKDKKLNLNEEEVFVNVTPPGQKKKMSEGIAEKYNPMAVEAAWDLWWEAKGFYSVKAEELDGLSAEDKFVMVLPPPNVTGTLHIGHALMLAVEDTLARYNRMLGKKVLWVPGTDHAGIATQAVVEAKLLKETGKKRTDFSREEFLKKVWSWTEEKGGLIFKQMRRMGASMDFSRNVFTLDEKRSAAVVHAFITLYDMGLIYRKKRLVNWCSALGTAISNIEVDSIELEKRQLISIKSHNNRKYEFGVLQEFMYPVEGSKDEKVIVATTRLETMLGDVAVCVHPDDERYKHLHGKNVLHPFFKRSLPIICDAELVDMNFGTGCVKITPAHDENDYKCGERHSLPMLNMLNDDGTIDVTECKTQSEELGDTFQGLPRYEARAVITEKLAELGLLGEKSDNKMVLPICSKSGDIIEPRLKEQWWIDTEEMSKRSLEAVENGDLKIFPEFHKETWRRFLTDPHQWCISRQLWWGHRIPAYKVSTTNSNAQSCLAENGKEWIIAKDESSARQKLSKVLKDLKLDLETTEFSLLQDEDVLDTWFSSGLFPFSVFDWPEKNSDVDNFFPGSLLETGHDILFFWVARMVMMSLTLHDKLPFTTVYLHAIVRDRYGRKMSKSLGNIIDPLAVINGCSLEDLNSTIRNANLPEKEIEKAVKGQKVDFPDGIPQCGSDALRFGLLSNINQGRDVNLDVNSIFATRKFCNKLWQVTRFAILMCGEDLSPEVDFLKRLNEFNLSHRDKWILSELRQTTGTANSCLEKYAFGEYTACLTNFWLNKLCDVYVETIKPVLKDESKPEQILISKNILFCCLDTGLKLLHPVMPFVTEELWNNLPGNKARLLQLKEGVVSDLKESIMISCYPTSASLFAEDFSTDVTLMETALAISRAMRSVKSEFNISKKDTAFTVVVDNSRLKALEEVKGDIENLGGGIIAYKDEIDEENSAGGFHPVVIDAHLQLRMQMKGNIDIEAQIRKLEKELVLTKKSHEGVTKKLDNEKFISSASEEVLTKTRQKQSEAAEILKKLSSQINNLKLL